MTRFLPFVLCAVAIAGCGDAEQEVARSTPPVWTEHPVPERGARVMLPPGWHLASESLTPHLADPYEVFSAANFPLRHHPAQCAQKPSALDDLGPAGVLVSVQERGRGSVGDAYPARPENFAPLPDPGQLECTPAHGELHWYSFADGGRNFYGMVAYGPEATAAARADGFEVLSRAVYAAASGPN